MFSKANFSFENKQKYLKIVSDLKLKLPYGAIAKLAKQHLEINERYFYRVMDGVRFDLIILDLLKKEVKHYEPEQENISTLISNS